MCKARGRSLGVVFQVPAYRTPSLESGPACPPLFGVKQTVLSPGMPRIAWAGHPLEDNGVPVTQGMLS